MTCGTILGGYRFSTWLSVALGMRRYECIAFGMIVGEVRDDVG